MCRCSTVLPQQHVVSFLLCFGSLRAVQVEGVRQLAVALLPCRRCRTRAPPRCAVSSTACSHAAGVFSRCRVMSLSVALNPKPWCQSQSAVCSATTHPVSRGAALARHLMIVVHWCGLCSTFRAVSQRQSAKAARQSQLLLWNVICETGGAAAFGSVPRRISAAYFNNVYVCPSRTTSRTTFTRCSAGACGRCSGLRETGGSSSG